MYAGTLNKCLIKHDINDLSDLTYNYMVLKPENSAPPRHNPSKQPPFRNFNHCSMYFTPVRIVSGAASVYSLLSAMFCDVNNETQQESTVVINYSFCGFDTSYIIIFNF